jgi:hypothetical protein
LGSSWNRSDRRRRSTDGALYLLGAAGLAASITLLFLGMRAVLGVGGFCAEGGPYVIDVHCPPGVVEVMPLSMFGLFIFGGLMFWKGASLGGPYGGLPFLAWPALFISLGWNFLEFGFNPPCGGLALGWLIPGIVFVVMGGGPLAVVASAWRHGRSKRGPDVGSWSPRLRSTGDERDLRASLSRLDRLHDSGMLTGVEYEAARRAALGTREARP